MRAKPSLLGTLSKARELQSTKLKDVQDFLDRIIRALNSQYQLLWQDVSTIQVDADGFIYFGNKDTNGSWRIGRDGVDWVLDHRESGAWVNASTQEAT